MDIIIPLLIVSVLIGIPTWLIVQTVNKADKSTIIYSPEEVTRRLRKGFYLSFWGMVLLFGGSGSVVLILWVLARVFLFIVVGIRCILSHNSSPYETEQDFEITAYTISFFQKTVNRNSRLVFSGILLYTNVYLNYAITTKRW